jgi:simple sugar transport system substrate-binding protein/ribose transport system substrate-binding protein
MITHSIQHRTALIGLMLAGFLPAIASAEENASFTLAQTIQDRIAKGEKPIIRVSYHDVSNEFAPFIKKGVEKAVADFGVDAKLVGPVGADAEKQVSEIESLIEKGVDGLAISSVSTDALAPVIQRAMARGIPVVTFNTDNPSSKRLAFVGQNLVESGRVAGKLLADTLGGKGSVIITTLDAAAQWSIDREKGAREALGKYPDIKILTTVTTGTEPQQIYGSIENAMQAHPNVDGILSLECCSTPAAGQYVQRNGLADKVKIVGFDLLPETIKLVQGNVVAATIDQGPEKQSYDAVQLLLDVLKGKKIQDVDTGAVVYTSKNIGDYVVASKEQKQ